MEGIEKPFGRQKTDRLATADPTKFSRIVLPAEQFTAFDKNDHDRPIVGNEEGERFHEITQNPETQQFVSRILKPFFNVADVVEINGAPYSYEPSLANVAPSSRDEVLADIEMIKYLVHDSDRQFKREPVVTRYKDEDGYTHHHYHGYDRETDVGHNFKYENNKHIFYDFGLTNFWLPFEGAKFQEYFIVAKEPQQKSMREKLARMVEYYTSAEGKGQVEGAFKKTGKSIDELFTTPVESRGLRHFLDPETGKYHIPFDVFYAEFVRRVTTMSHIAGNVVSQQPIPSKRPWALPFLNRTKKT